MALLARDSAGKVEKQLEARLKAGRERLQTIAPQRDESWEFVRGNHYCYVDDKNILQILPTTTTVRGTGKPRWRARQRRNLIFDVVVREASVSTQPIPSYQVIPTSAEPEDIAAAHLAEKVLLYGHHRWRIRQAAVDAVMHAVVGGEAFAWAFFDNTIGPFIEDGSGGLVGQGDVRIGIYGGNECYWEPGLRFEKSPWHAVEQAQPQQQVEEMDGFLLKPNSLTPDADTRQLSNRGRTGAGGKRRLVLVTNYLERPCVEYPEGRWIVLANNQRIVPDRPYPGDGEEPVLRKLSYVPDPDSDRDLGLIPQIIDAQRTFNDCNNKAIEWKNLCLLPRIIVSPGLFKKQRWTDEPGKVYEIPQPEQNFKVVDTPVVPGELFEMADRARDDLQRIAAQMDLPSGVTAAQSQAIFQQSQDRDQMFRSNLAEFYAGMGHDCLNLVQESYSEPRLLDINGDFGWEPIADFKGAQLRQQVNVRVLPDSIEPQTKQNVEQRVMAYVQLGMISPEEGIAAIEAGTAEVLSRSLRLDEARAGRIIQRIKEGPAALFSMPTMPTGRMEQVPQIDPATGQPAIDPMTGQPVMVDGPSPEMAPGWMPRRSDNLPVFKSIFEDWMKTEEYERLEPGMQAATAEIYNAILMLEQQLAQEAQAAQAAQAEKLGMQNASNPQRKPLPSLPTLNGAGQGTPAPSGPQSPSGNGS